MPPTGFFGVFKEKAYRADALAWSAKSTKAEKLVNQAGRLFDRLQERYREATINVVGTLKAKFPRWAATVAEHKKVIRIEKFRKEAEEREAKRAQKRGRDRGMSR